MRTRKPMARTLRSSPVVLTLSSLAVAGCSAAPPADAASPGSPGTTGAPAEVTVESTSAGPAVATSSPMPAPTAAPTAAPEARHLLVKDVGLKTPESVLHDPESDVYLVSNIDGKPTEADGAGFISRVSPDGKVLELKWIEGKKNGVTLNAPKGLALSGPHLYVTDLTFVRIFNRKTGAPTGKVLAPGATFLNDIAVAPDGTVFVTDSGLKAGKDGFEPTGTDAVYRIGKSGKAEKLTASADLGRPNGLLADKDGVWVATFGSGSLYRIGLDGKQGSKHEIPGGSLDGLVRLPDDSMLVSSWGGSQVLRGKPGGEFSPVVGGVRSPADIGYDAKRYRILIPLFTEDALHIADLPGGSAEGTSLAPVATPPLSVEPPRGAPTTAAAKAEGPPAAPSAEAEPAAPPRR